MNERAGLTDTEALDRDIEELLSSGGPRKNRTRRKKKKRSRRSSFDGFSSDEEENGETGTEVVEGPREYFEDGSENEYEECASFLSKLSL